jgi:CelD/BcsL family acetyltransferase involved in cellulose biosynthesis
MTVLEIDPLVDRRWVELVDRHACASVFHSTEWLGTLRRTYGYEPMVLTDAAPDEPLRNGLVFCRVASWMTGRRLVSLPFSDHCEPLTESQGILVSMLESLKRRTDAGRYIELRPVTPLPSNDGFNASAEYYLHSIDLRPDLGTIFARFHRSQTQRAIRAAERAGTAVECGRSMRMLEEFYALHALTRRRQGVPIQPFAWFQNLVNCLGDRLEILMARREGRPVAALITIAHRRTLVYKYGCSERSQASRGAMPLLFWTAIQRAKAKGFQDFDLGRSDLENVGLQAFKDHLGGNRATLTYYRSDRVPVRHRRALSNVGFARRAYALVPNVIRVGLSKVLYRHFG